MTSLNEDLERAAAVLRGVTDHEVEVVPKASEYDEAAVYVNFGYHEALVIWPQLDQFGKRWAVTATAWDRTGGVSDELELGVVRMEYLPGIVRQFLEEQDKRERELDEALSSMNDEG